jgi:hypothetical protein
VWRLARSQPFARSSAQDKSEVPLGMAGHHARPRVRRVASDPESASRLIIAAVVSEIALETMVTPVSHQSTTLGRRSCPCVHYMSSTQAPWSISPSIDGLEITAHRGQSASRPRVLARVEEHRPSADADVRLSDTGEAYT